MSRCYSKREMLHAWTKWNPGDRRPCINNKNWVGCTRSCPVYSVCFRPDGWHSDLRDLAAFALAKALYEELPKKDDGK